MMTASAVVLRPKKIRKVAWACAIGLVAVFTVVGVLLLTRPKVNADATGISVRNVVTSHRFEWTDVLAISFPDGAAWARLELPEDEYISIMAVQAVDREYAVKSVRALRELHKAAH